MNVSRNKNRIARLAGSENHRLNRTGRSLDGKEGSFRTKSSRSQFLRLLDHMLRMVQIIERFDVDLIKCKSGLTEKTIKFRVNPFALFVTGDMKGERLFG